MKFLPILFLITTSCLALTDPLFSSLPNENNFINRFPENKKGIVILKLSSDYLTLSWCKTDLQSESKEKDCVKINPTSYYQIIMLPPGWYELQGYKQVNRRFQAVKEREIEPQFSNITGKRKSPPILAFKVEEAKICYAGHIKFHHISASGALQVKDEDFLEIQKLFIKQEQKPLLKIFKGHKLEEKIIAAKIVEDPSILVRQLAKTKADFAEEKQIDKKQEREEKKILKEKIRMNKKILKNSNSTFVKPASENSPKNQSLFQKIFKKNYVAN